MDTGNFSVVDPNTLDLDLDPGSDPGFRVPVIQFQKKKLKIILENIFLLKKVPIFFKNYQNKISPKEIVILLSL